MTRTLPGQSNMINSITRKIPVYILPLIVLSQFAGTSLWFAGNAILPGLQQQFQLPDTLLGSITASVQLGFISGTLVFAVWMIADRFSPVNTFMVSAVAAAFFNLLIIFSKGNITLLLLLRFMTGFFLAGVYPVGMKIAADWYAAGLGKALGFLVGALVLGTAFPHWLRSSSYHLPWQQVILCTSILAGAGGLAVKFFLKDGPHRSEAPAFQAAMFSKLFRVKYFRAAAFGYFGHMWEIYTLWAFVPVLLKWYNQQHHTALPVASWSFLVIAAGSIGCIGGGYIARTAGSEKVAFFALAGSGVCCILSPLLLCSAPAVFLTGMIIWGILVTADSPQFSALATQTVDPFYKGTALTMVTCIGFGITVISIQLLNYLWLGTGQVMGKEWVLLLLGIGPVSGLLLMRQLLKREPTK